MSTVSIRSEIQAARGPVWQLVALVASFAPPFAAAALGGAVTTRALSPWYAGLRKPDWTPDGRVIVTVGTVLYALMGLAGWRVWRSTPSRQTIALAGHA